MYTRKLLNVMMLIAMVGALFVACAPQPTPVPKPEVVATSTPVVIVVTATPKPTPVVKKTLRFVAPSELRFLDPARASGTADGILVRNIYSRLLEVNPEGTEITPDLAEKYEVSPDGLIYTFHLRKDVKFHDGAPLVADDVVYSYQRALAANMGDAAAYLQGIVDPAKIVAVDDHTVRMTLNKAWPPFLMMVAQPRTLGILSKKWVEAHKTTEDPWAFEYVKDHANGTGPFKFVEWVPKQYVRLERFDGYYKGPAKIEEVFSQVNTDDTVTRLALEKGDVDVVDRLPDEMMRVMAKNPNLIVASKPYATFMYWIFNCQKAPFTDKRVRQAFAYAVDYDGLMANVVKQGGIRMTSPLLKGMLGFDESLPPIQRDVDKAKSLLAEAGYAKGLSIDMPYVKFGLIPNMAVVLQANLADVGVTAKLQEIPLATLLTGVEEGTFAFFPWNGSAAYPHPDSLFIQLLTEKIGTGTSGNVGYYSSAEYDRIYHHSETAKTEAEQLADYRDLQRLAMDDMPLLLLYQENQYRGTGSWVSGYEFGPYNYCDFWAMDVKH